MKPYKEKEIWKLIVEIRNEFEKMRKNTATYGFPDFAMDTIQQDNNITLTLSTIRKLRKRYIKKWVVK